MPISQTVYPPLARWSILWIVLGVALLILIPTRSHAVPASGDYVFTSGLTGTFTSTGSVLSLWNMGDTVGGGWNNLIDDQTVVTNSRDTFTVTAPFYFTTTYLLLQWAADPAATTVQFSMIPNLQGFISGTAGFTRVSTPVPEGASSGVVVIGLLVLLGYAFKQQRRVGVRV